MTKTKTPDAVIRAAIEEDPGASDAAIAASTGAHHDVVSDVRYEMAAEARAAAAEEAD
jgi:hypothetical protein